MPCIIKCILLGESGVGKTALALKYFENTFCVDDNNPTIGVDFHTKLLTISDKEYKLQVWDTAGQERFHSIIKSYFTSTNCVLFCFSLIDRTSFKALNNIIDNFDSTVSHRTGRILVGTFSDKQKEIVVNDSEIQELVREKNIDYYFDVSSLDGHNLDHLFHAVVAIPIRLNAQNLLNLKTYEELFIDNSKKNKSKDKKCCIIT